MERLLLYYCLWMVYCTHGVGHSIHCILSFESGTSFRISFVRFPLCRCCKNATRIDNARICGRTPHTPSAQSHRRCSFGASQHHVSLALVYDAKTSGAFSRANLLALANVVASWSPRANSICAKVPPTPNVRQIARVVVEPFVLLICLGCRLFCNLFRWWCASHS
jgi:hypothetical protein